MAYVSEPLFGTRPQSMPGVPPPMSGSMPPSYAGGFQSMGQMPTPFGDVPLSMPPGPPPTGKGGMSSMPGAPPLTGFASFRPEGPPAPPFSNGFGPPPAPAPPFSNSFGAPPPPVPFGVPVAMPGQPGPKGLPSQPFGMMDRRPQSMPMSPDRAKLIGTLQQQDQKIQELTAAAQRLRNSHGSAHGSQIQRLEDIEARILSAKIIPHLEESDLPPEQRHNANQVPNGLLQEFFDRANIIEDDIAEELTPAEERKRLEQEHLAHVSIALGLPTLQDLGLPDEATIVDIRKVVAPDVSSEYRFLPFGAPTPFEEKREHMKEAPRKPPEPIVYGRVYNSNYALLPSPYHPVGSVSQEYVDGRKLLSGVYPIDRAPIRYDSVFDDRAQGPLFCAPETYYKAYADFYASRAFNNTSPQLIVEEDADQKRLVHNVLWRPPGYVDPVATLALDLNKDGIADTIVIGKDKDFDGIPDVLQVPSVERMAANTMSKIFHY